MKAIVIFSILMALLTSSAWPQNVGTNPWWSISMASIKSDCVQTSCLNDFLIDDIDLKQNEQGYLILNMTIHSKKEYNILNNPLDAKLYERVLNTNPFFSNVDITTKFILSNPQITLNPTGQMAVKLQFACTFEGLSFRRTSDFVQYFTTKSMSCFNVFEKFYNGL